MAGLAVYRLIQHQVVGMLDCRAEHGFRLNVLYPSRRQLPLAVAAFIALVTEKLALKAFATRPIRVHL